MNPVSMKSPRTDLTKEPTVTRPTPKSGVAFRDIVSRSALGLAQGAQSVVTQLPGGPVLAAAVRGGPSAGAPTAHLPGGAVPRPVAGTSSVGTALSGPAEGPSTPGLPEAGTSVEATLVGSHDMNLYFLQLQEAIAAESRAYTASSNVMKARHDTVKNAIGNIR